MDEPTAPPNDIDAATSSEPSAAGLDELPSDVAGDASTKAPSTEEHLDLREMSGQAQLEQAVADAFSAEFATGDEASSSAAPAPNAIEDDAADAADATGSIHPDSIAPGPVSDAPSSLDLSIDLSDIDAGDGAVEGDEPETVDETGSQGGISAALSALIDPPTEPPPPSAAAYSDIPPKPLAPAGVPSIEAPPIASDNPSVPPPASTSPRAEAPSTSDAATKTMSKAAPPPPPPAAMVRTRSPRKRPSDPVLETESLDEEFEELLASDDDFELVIEDGELSAPPPSSETTSSETTSPDPSSLAASNPSEEDGPLGGPEEDAENKGFFKKLFR